ncbi:MAG: GDP-mannose 4,6-dehydratase [Candidatus Curtissbacteria bacterium]|nr:GDP-mannose 4,6-dehydratase [Candidatus Curtissbacteria bacterium]
MALRGKNVLVTGGCGFYGGHLVERLVNLGCNVFVTDLLIHPKSYFLQQKLDEKVVFEYCDIGNFDHINSVITKNEIDLVFHLAAVTTVDAAFHNPRQTVISNVVGTTNVLESCRLYGKVEGVLFTSTDKAYGKLPRVSEKNPISGDHPYEVSKSSADLIARSYFKTYNLPVVVTRFGNVYGEGDLNFNRLIPGIMESVVKNKELKIRSNGKYIRDYVYVKDVVDATLTLANNISKVQGEAFNVSSLENLSVIDVVKRVENILGEKIKYRILSTAVNEIPTQSVNFNKIRKAFGWKPNHNFKTSMGDILTWYREYFDLH